MLRANRRHRLLYLALAGMDVATTLPVLLFALRATSVGAAGAGVVFLTFALFWGATILFMLAADSLNRRAWGGPARAAALLLLVATTTLLAEAILFRSGLLPAELRRSLRALSFGPPLFVALYLIFLWWRVAALTSRELSFFSVGMSFRFGMLISLAACSLLAFGGGGAQAEATALGGDKALVCLLLFFAFGLTAAALARIDDKAFMADHSRGALLPWPRFAQLLAAVAATLGLALAAARLLAPDAVGRLLGRLAPVGGLIGALFALLLTALLWLLNPLLVALERLLTRLVANQQESAADAAEALDLPMPTDVTSFMEIVQRSPLLRLLLIGGAVLIALLLIALFFARTLDAMRRDEPEETAPEAPDLAPAPPRLRRPGLFGLARRYGLSRSLLAAVSVQNLYANVTRLARRRGFPRPPATPPDGYLPLLEQAFPGHAAALAHLTDAYMRVHYGETPADAAELALLRAEYEKLKGAESRS